MPIRRNRRFARGKQMSRERPIPAEQLDRWREEAEALDVREPHGSERRARVAVMDVSVVLDLLDEIDSLKAAFVPGPRNAKCAAFYTPEIDGLAQDWRSVCWMNPP